MKRIIWACLGFEAPDLWLVLPVSLVPAATAELITVLAAAGDDHEAVGMLSAVGMLLTVLLCCVLGVVYLCGSFPLLLQFSASRRGLLAGICLHILWMTLLAEGISAAAVTGLCAVNGMFFPIFSFARLWQIVSPLAWLACAVLPVLVGLTCAGVNTRFGRKGNGALYILFIGGCFSVEKWLSIFSAQPELLLLPAAMLAIMAGCGVRWMMKAAVK